MKKLLITAAVVLATIVSSYADEGFAYGVWFDNPKGVKNTNVDGVAVGLPVISFNNLSGSSLAFCGNLTEKATGFEFALLGFNKSQSMDGAQVALVNIQNKQHGDFTVQIGCYNQTGEQGIQIGAINNSRNNALFQLGLININKNGLFPAMILVNFSKEMFD